MGGIQSVLGYPTSDEAWGANNSRFSNFQNGAIYWTFANGAYEVHGAIFQHWNSLGREAGKLGLPTQDEAATQGGRFSRFQYGMIYWSPASGAYEVNGSIRDKWFDLGANYKFLGFPTSDETVGANNSRFSNFQGGSIFWGYTTGAFEVHGAILAKYRSLGREGSFLGLPLSDESAGANGCGTTTSRAGRSTGRRPPAPTRSTAPSRASGPASTGSAGILGLPTSDEQAGANGGRFSEFQGGKSTGRLRPATDELHGILLDGYLSNGADHSALGYPLSDVQNRTDGQAGFVAFFQHGYMTSSGNSGVTVHLY